MPKKCVECEKKDAEIKRLKKRASHQNTFDLGKRSGFEDVIKIMLDKIEERSENEQSIIGVRC